MVNDFLWPELDGIDLGIVYFQQDGATYHTIHETIDLLREKFPDHVISRRGDHNWPPRSQIQNAGLGEFRIRDLNDEINKLLREKQHWEDQIKELGGPDYQKVGPRMLDHEGKEVPGNRGYKYFEAAKELPSSFIFL
nr:unnamed protein product [Callosobruchus chinensis]